MQTPRVFLSYSHDSDSHRDAVLQLAYDLRKSGIEAQMDRFTVAPAQGWPRWMIAEIDAADFVLVVCSNTYLRRFDGREQAGTGQGATLEGLLATQYIYNSSTLNTKFIPILLAGHDPATVPTLLQPYTRYKLPQQWEGLLRHLTGQPEIIPPPLGSLPVLLGRSTAKAGETSGTQVASMTIRSDGAATNLMARQVPGTYRMVGSNGRINYDLYYDDPAAKDDCHALMRVIQALISGADLGFWEKNDFGRSTEFCSGILHATLAAWVGQWGDGISPTVPTREALKGMIEQLEGSGFLSDEIVQFDDEGDEDDADDGNDENAKDD